MSFYLLNHLVLKELSPYVLILICQLGMGDCLLVDVAGEVGGWGRDPKKCTGRD